MSPSGSSGGSRSRALAITAEPQEWADCPGAAAEGGCHTRLSSRGHEFRLAPRDARLARDPAGPPVLRRAPLGSDNDGLEAGALGRLPDAVLAGARGQVATAVAGRHHRLAQPAADNGLLDPALASGVSRLRGVKTAGVRLGNWLAQADAQRLLEAPDVTTRKGVRDRAILAVLLGCGLRRSEVAALEVRHLQQRDGRWVTVDLVGKGRRTRSVLIPSWARWRWMSGYMRRVSIMDASSPRCARVA